MEPSVKKPLIVLALAITLSGLVACTNTVPEQPPFTIGSDNTIVRVQSTSPTSQQGTKSLTVSEGHGICINHTAIQGSFHVRIASDAGTTVFDQDLSGDEPVFIADIASGTYNVTVSSDNACGRVEVLVIEVPGENASQAPVDIVLPGMPSAVGGHETGTENTPAEPSEQ